MSNPPLAINLHYLVTAYGANQFDPEILLAFAMRVFHNTPVVPRASFSPRLRRWLRRLAENEQKLIAGSTLASQIEHIRITPEALTTEEIYRLWTAFQVSYRPTTSYQVSVVVIQDTQSFQSNRPVRRVAGGVAANRAGDFVGFAADGCRPVDDHQRQNFLNGPPSNTQVSFNEGAPVAPATVQGNLLRVVVPSTLEAGACNVRVMCDVTFPSSTTPHPCFASNPVPFQLIPVIQPPTLPAVPPYTVSAGRRAHHHRGSACVGTCRTLWSLSVTRRFPSRRRAAPAAPALPPR